MLADAGDRQHERGLTTEERLWGPVDGVLPVPGNRRSPAQALLGEPMCYAAADINLDGRVDASDESAWLALLQMGGMNPVTGEPDRRMDLNGDGDVSQADFDLWDVAYRQARQQPTGNPLPAPQWANDTPFNGVAEGGVLSVPTRRGTFPPESASAGGTWVMHGVDNRFGFAGYMWDPFLKLYHVRHRVYDPMGGRWLQRDPIGMAGGWNLYQYCGGEPWGRIDPSGLDWFDHVVNFGAGFGDAVTFGLTSVIRGSSINEAVDKTSGAYAGGVITGAITASVVPGAAAAGATAAGARLVATGSVAADVAVLGVGGVRASVVTGAVVGGAVGGGVFSVSHQLTLNGRIEARQLTLDTMLGFGFALVGQTYRVFFSDMLGLGASQAVLKTAEAQAGALGSFAGKSSAENRRLLRARGFTSTKSFDGTGEVWTKSAPDGRTVAVRIDPPNPKALGASRADAVPHVHKEIVPTDKVKNGNYKPKHVEATLDDCGSPSDDYRETHIPIRKD